MSLHIGILQTDSVLPEFQDEHGDYPHMFENLFVAADERLRFTTYDVQSAPPEHTECDAYVITGSRHSVYDDQPWIPALADFVEAALTADRKIIGICFGHQLMAHFFGGSVGAHHGGWAVGVHTSQVVTRQAWMPDSEASFALLSSHQDQVQELPQSAEVYLSNTFCPIAGFTMGNQVITVQSHPEFSAPYARALLERRRELLGEHVYQMGVESLAEETSEDAMARWLLAFAAADRG